MTTRNWVLVAVFVTLGLIYAVFFTEWFRPAPIEIASQVRFAIQPPRFGRPPRKPAQPRAMMSEGSLTGDVHRVVWVGKTGEVVRLDGTNVLVKRTFPGGDAGPVVQTRPNNSFIPAKPGDGLERVGLPEKGKIEQAPGGVANVTFSLDGWYRLTRLRVEDVPADGSAPNVVWQLVGKSLPLDSLLYDRVPTGMKVIPDGATAEPLKPGVPYRLIVEAGRRRGTNNFHTVELRPQE